MRVSSTSTAARCLHLHSRSSAGNALGFVACNAPSGRGSDDDDAAQVDEGGEEAAAPSEHQVPPRARHEESDNQSVTSDERLITG